MHGARMQLGQAMTKEREKTTILATPNAESSMVAYVVALIRLLFLQSHLTFIQGYQGYDSQTYEADPTVSYSQKSQNQSHGAATGSAAAGGFGKKRQASSEPSPHVIFLGLDPDFSEADVCRL